MISSGCRLSFNKGLRLANFTVRYLNSVNDLVTVCECDVSSRESIGIFYCSTFQAFDSAVKGEGFLERFKSSFGSSRQQCGDH